MATHTVFVYTMNRGIAQGAWSRYVFPWTCEHFAHLESTLYIRHGAIVSFVIEGAIDDDGIGFEGVIQWPWLDFGQHAQNFIEKITGQPVPVTDTIFASYNVIASLLLSSPCLSCTP